MSKPDKIRIPLDQHRFENVGRLPPPSSYFTMSIDSGLRGHRTRYKLAVIYRDQGKLTQAEAQWRAVLAERPDSTLAWLGLLELYLAQKRDADAEQMVQ
jgi:predicted Zn-dependent protease